MKKGIVILGLVSAISLSACGSIPVLNSSSDDSEVIAQSKAVIEQSKAVVEESKAVEKAKGNNESLEEAEVEKITDTEEVSHPFMILECEGEKFDMANDTMKDLVQFWQKSGTHYGRGLSQILEPYTAANSDVHCRRGIDWCSVSVYNPFDKEITLKDAKIGGSYGEGTMRFEEDTPDNIKFLNGKVNFNSNFEEWMEAFKEEAKILWDQGAYEEAQHIASEKDEKYTGPYPPEDRYANVLSYNFKDDDNWTIAYDFRLNDGREVYIEFIHRPYQHFLRTAFAPYFE